MPLVHTEERGLSVWRRRMYQAAAANPATAAARNMFRAPITPMKTPPTAYLAALPAKPQLTSSAYEPVSGPGAATSWSVRARRGPFLVGREHAGVQRAELVGGDIGEADAQGPEDRPPVIER